MEIKEFESYLAFVAKAIKEYESVGDLIRGDMVVPSKVNYALASYYEMSLAMNSEYQRVKMENAENELLYQRWYDKKFEECKREVIDEYASTKIKPSLKEFEVRVRTKNADEFHNWQIKLIASEAKVRFMLRLIDTMDKQDKTLTNLSNNMRSEMYSLSIDRRANTSPVTVERSVVRTGFPEKEDYLERRKQRDAECSEES